MVDGVPKNDVDELWSQLNPSNFESLYESLKLSVPRVLQSLHTGSDLKPEQEVAFYYLKDFWTIWIKSSWKGSYALSQGDHLHL